MAKKKNKDLDPETGIPICDVTQADVEATGILHAARELARRVDRIVCERSAFGKVSEARLFLAIEHSSSASERLARMMYGAATAPREEG